MSATNLPKVLDQPISHDPDRVAAMTGFDRTKVGGRYGFKLPDDEEGDLVAVIRTGYFRCIKAGNPKPDLTHILGAADSRKVKVKIRDAVGKGNAYGKLLIPVLDGKKSPYWAMLESVLRDPTKHGFEDIPGLRKEVILEPVGKDAASLPKV